MLEASELARLHFGGGRVAFAPTCQNLTCEHCMRSESETNDALPPPPPKLLTVNFCPLLTIFLNEP